MDALERIRELLDQYEWSVYKLSVKSGLPQSTLANMFARNNLPTIPTLEMICAGFGISMSEFFDYTADDGASSVKKTLLTKYNRLNEEQKKLIIDIINNMK